MSRIASCNARTSDRRCGSRSVCASLLQGSAEEYLPWRTHPPSFTRLSSGTAKGESGCARRHGGALLRLRRPSGLGSSRCAGTLQESAPGRLGAAIPRVRPG